MARHHGVPENHGPALRLSYPQGETKSVVAACADLFKPAAPQTCSPRFVNLADSPGVSTFRPRAKGEAPHRPEHRAPAGRRVGAAEVCRERQRRGAPPDEKSNNPMAYDLNATEWEQWKSLGASDAYFAVYGRFASDCDALSASSTGAPSGGLMAALIVKFKREAIAARTYGTDSTLLGFGPRDIAFIKLVGGSVTTGSDTGLGPRSVIGSGSVAGSTYYFAFWQNKVFESFLGAYDVASADARGAANNVNQRIH